MNCERFQKNLLEYLDEALTPPEMLAARTHLAGCSICRKVLQRELELLRSLSNRMERAVEHVTLEPHAQRAMVAALERETAEPPRLSLISLWRRLVLPLAAAMAMLLVTLWTGQRYMAGADKNASGTVTNVGEQQVLVHVSYPAPVYTFQENGDTVMDALTTEPRVADGTLLVKKQESTDHNHI